MHPIPTYKIGSEIITKHEEALMHELPALYPNEAEREIVEQVLIPQFRALIVQVLEEFEAKNGRAAVNVVAPAEMPVLCGKVDEAILENKVLLDVDGLFNPVFGRIKEVREEVAKELEEEFKRKCRDSLKTKGITDRNSLLNKGVVQFMDETFPLFGQGLSLAGKIFGRPIHKMTISLLNQLADYLDLCLRSEESKKCFANLLTDAGVNDRMTFLHKGLVWFNNQPFPPYGKGASFARHIIGHSVSPISVDHLNQIADILELPQLSEKSKIKLRQLLANKGVYDRYSLRNKGAAWFRKVSFPPFGKGYAFATAIIGENQKKIYEKTLHQIADILELPQLSEESKIKLREALANSNILDRMTLYKLGANRFEKESFPPFGKGCLFYKKLFGKSVKFISLDHLRAIADALDLKQMSEESKQMARELLAQKGIIDRMLLLQKGAVWFMDETFPPYGKGRAFAAAILGKTKVQTVTVDILEEIVNAIDLPKKTEDDLKALQMEVLGKKGITSRENLFQKEVGWFIRESFDPFGMGTAFASKILGRTVKAVTLNVIQEIADKLFPEDSDDSP